MRIYIAAPFPLRNDAIKAMHWLESQGHHVTSRWLKDVEDLLDVSMQGIYAEKCAADVFDADLLLALNASEWMNVGTGGRHVELGIALTLGKPIVIVGVRTNVFHHLDCVRVIDAIEDL